MLLPRSTVAVQKSRKSARITAYAAIRPPMRPTTAPAMNPSRRPMRRMSSEAGIVVSAVATIASEIGTVANEGRGAMSAAPMPPRITVTVRPDETSIWAPASVNTLRSGCGDRLTGHQGTEFGPTRARIDASFGASMSEIALRLARLGDAPRIANLSRTLIESGLPWSWTPRRVAAHMRSREHLTVIAAQGGELAGFVLAQFGTRAVHIALLGVAHAYQRRGLGRQLVSW